MQSPNQHNIPSPNAQGYPANIPSNVFFTQEQQRAAAGQQQVL